MKRLILTAAVLVLTAVSAEAGPIRGLVQRLTHRGGCGSCGQVQYTPAVQPPVLSMPQTGTLTLVTHATSYHPAAGGFDATPYQPIRLTQPLPVCPTCSNGVCR